MCGQAMSFEIDYITYAGDCEIILTIGFDMAEPDYDVGFNGGVDDWYIISTGSCWWTNKKNINLWYKELRKNTKLHDGIMQACCKYASEPSYSEYD